MLERERALSTSIKNCPDLLKYQFEGKLSFNISDKCCYRLKKEIAKKWQISYNKSIVITGIRAEEGGMRNQGGCTVFDGNDLHKFHPIKIVSDEWEDEFLKRYNIKLCKLYYPPYNFKRTGCKGCPFNKDVASELLTMKKLLPNEYKQCLYLWKPVYDEYIRLGYRLRKDFYEIKPQYTIEDYLGEEE